MKEAIYYSNISNEFVLLILISEMNICSVLTKDHFFYKSTKFTTEFLVENKFELIGYV